MDDEGRASKVVALVPARGGSKGIPRKNLVELGGDPLLVHTLRAAERAESVDRVIVSSDDPEILRVAETSGAKALERPSELARDETPVGSVIEHAFEREALAERFDVLALLQPTSPFRDEKDIDGAVEKLSGSGATGLISVTRPRVHPMKAMTVQDDGFLGGLYSPEAPFRNRQSLPEALVPNGAIYLVYLEAYRDEKTLLTSKALPYEMPESKSLDIDTPEDLQRAREVLGRREAGRNR